MKNYALSLYVDLRLGIDRDAVLSVNEAKYLVAKAYGPDAARQAAAICGER